MSLRIAAGIALLIVTSLFSGEFQNKPSYELFLKRTWTQGIGPDALSAYMIHTASLKPFLPEHGVIGYVTDDPSLGNFYKFLLIRHALAPLVVERKSPRQYVVGTFRDILARDKAAEQNDLRLIKDFGYGLALFKGKAEP